jgi:3'-phosphoadenosine 5'-phosphosulfate sulfotransferase (PAPS reductase)/FAD synthetase
MSCKPGRDPYHTEGPTLLSLSGGRSSGYMLWRILQAHGGALPADTHVVFCNTGKERPETLDFVRDMGERWNVPIVWLEWCLWMRTTKSKKTASGFVTRQTAGFDRVYYETASRNGEPFAALIARKKYLPNTAIRFCTEELKVKTCVRFMRSLGYARWNNVIGFRGDEPRRVAKAKAKNDEGKRRWVDVMPMHEAHVSSRDVAGFWKAQPFDLAIESWEGNCDGCFLIGVATMVKRLRARPEIAPWWSERERERERRHLPEGAAHAGGRGHRTGVDDARRVQLRGGLGRGAVCLP